MSMFSNMTTEGMEESKDTLGGYQPLDSDIYLAKIKTAYITISKNNAMAVNFVADIEGREYREQLWITNSKGENFFINKKTGNKVPLPGFTTLNDICIASIGKELKQLDTETKVFKIYDYDAKTELPKEVPTIVDLIDAEVKLGIIRQIVDKNVKDDSGNYVPSGETREENVIDKVFFADDNRTVNEVRTNKEVAEFYDKWLKKNKGQSRNRAQGAKNNAGKPGAPQKKAPTPTKSLFS